MCALSGYNLAISMWCVWCFYLGLIVVLLKIEEIECAGIALPRIAFEGCFHFKKKSN